MNNTLREFRRHAKWAGIPEYERLTVHSLRKSCGVSWANHLPMHVTQAYMGHADITTTQHYYLSVGEEHAKHASWVIDQVTMLNGDKNDAKVTPSWTWTRPWPWRYGSGQCANRCAKTETGFAANRVTSCPTIAGDRIRTDDVQLGKLGLALADLALKACVCSMLA